jgi:hypothetical protein
MFRCAKHVDALMDVPMCFSAVLNAVTKGDSSGLSSAIFGIFNNKFSFISQLAKIETSLLRNSH